MENIEKLGERLKSAREQSGLSVAELSDKTRIGRAFLQALEEGNYEKLPGEVFVVGFLRTYAREIGLDGDEVVARYKEETAPNKKAAQPEKDTDGADTPLAPKTGAQRDAAFIKLVVGALIFLAAVSALVYMGGDEVPTDTAPIVGSSEAPVAKADNSVAAYTSVTPALPTDAGPPVTPPSPSAPVDLKLFFATDSWLAYSIDGGERKDLGLMRAGAELSITAKKSVRLETGDAGGVEVVYNGRKLGFLGPRGAIRRDILFTPEVADARLAVNLGGQANPQPLPARPMANRTTPSRSQTAH